MALAAAAARSGRLVASRTIASTGSRASYSAEAKAGPSYDDYIHAEHMYNIPAMKYRKLKIGLGVFGSLAVGSFVPIYAVVYANKKTGSAEVLLGTS